MTMAAWGRTELLAKPTRRLVRLNMRRTMYVLLVVGTLLVQSVSLVVAASPSGKGTTTIRYQSAVYLDFTLGATVQCKGIHQYGPHWPGDATSGGRDVYRCRSLSGPFENVSHTDGFVYDTGQWSSDYFFDYHGRVVPNTRPVKLHIAGNNLSYHAIAYFAQP